MTDDERESMLRRKLRGLASGVYVRGIYVRGDSITDNTSAPGNGRDDAMVES